MSIEKDHSDLCQMRVDWTKAHPQLLVEYKETSAGGSPGRVIRVTQGLNEKADRMSMDMKVKSPNPGLQAEAMEETVGAAVQVTQDGNALELELNWPGDFSKRLGRMVRSARENLLQGQDMARSAAGTDTASLVRLSETSA